MVSKDIEYSSEAMTKIQNKVLNINPTNKSIIFITNRGISICSKTDLCLDTRKRNCFKASKVNYHD